MYFINIKSLNQQRSNRPIFYDLFGKICHLSGKWSFLGWPQPLGVFTALNKLIFFLWQCMAFCIVIYLDDGLVLVCSELEGRRAQSFLCSLLVCLGLHINFSKSYLHLTWTFLVFFCVLPWDTASMSVSLPPDKLAVIQKFALSFLQTKTCYSPSAHVLFREG